MRSNYISFAFLTIYVHPRKGQFGIYSVSTNMSIARIRGKIAKRNGHRLQIYSNWHEIVIRKTTDWENISSTLKLKTPTLNLIQNIVMFLFKQKHWKDSLSLSVLLLVFYQNYVRILMNLFNSSSPKFFERSLNIRSSYLYWISVPMKLRLLQDQFSPTEMWNKLKFLFSNPRSQLLFIVDTPGLETSASFDSLGTWVRRRWSINHFETHLYTFVLLKLNGQFCAAGKSSWLDLATRLCCKNNVFIFTSKKYRWRLKVTSVPYSDNSVQVLEPNCLIIATVSFCYGKSLCCLCIYANCFAM